MLNENIKNIRKNKGFTQEDLANRLHVSRQTISKWEKGYSVPDAEMLTKISDELDVPVTTLLGKEEIPQEEADALSEQLARINEQLSIRNRRTKRIWKTVLILFLVFFVAIPGIITIIGMTSDLEGADVGFNGSTEWVYSLDGKEYEYTIKYDKKYKIIATEGDSFIDDELDLSSYDDANEAGRALEAYFKAQGGEPISKEVKSIPLKNN